MTAGGPMYLQNPARTLLRSSFSDAWHATTAAAAAAGGSCHGTAGDSVSSSAPGSQTGQRTGLHYDGEWGRRRQLIRGRSALARQVTPEKLVELTTPIPPNPPLNKPTGGAEGGVEEQMLPFRALDSEVSPANVGVVSGAGASLCKRGAVNNGHLDNRYLANGSISGSIVDDPVSGTLTNSAMADGGYITGRIGDSPFAKSTGKHVSDSCLNISGCINGIIVAVDGQDSDVDSISSLTDDEEEGTDNANRSAFGLVEGSGNLRGGGYSTPRRENTGHRHMGDGEPPTFETACSTAPMAGNTRQQAEGGSISWLDCTTLTNSNVTPVTKELSFSGHVTSCVVSPNINTATPTKTPPSTKGFKIPAAVGKPSTTPDPGCKIATYSKPVKSPAAYSGDDSDTTPTRNTPFKSLRIPSMRRASPIMKTPSIGGTPNGRASSGGGTPNPRGGGESGSGGGESSSLSRVNSYRKSFSSSGLGLFKSGGSLSVSMTNRDSNGAIGAVQTVLDMALSRGSQASRHRKVDRWVHSWANG